MVRRTLPQIFRPSVLATRVLAPRGPLPPSPSDSRSSPLPAATPALEVALPFIIRYDGPLRMRRRVTWGTLPQYRTPMLSPAPTTEHQRGVDWLQNELRLPIFAHAYDTSVHLLQTRPPGYISLLAHIGRDFMNRLAPTAAGIRSAQVQYVQHIDALQERWRDEWGHQNVLTADRPSPPRSIPHDVCCRIQSLIDEHQAARDRSNSADVLFFSHFFHYQDHHKIPPNFLREWRDAKRWFVKHAHLHAGNHSREVERGTELHFDALSRLLLVAARTQLERTTALNAILEQTNG